MPCSDRVQPRPDIFWLARAEHGGLDHGVLEQEGLKEEEVLDFSVCVNPFLPGPSVRGVLRKLAAGPQQIVHYPDPRSRRLRQAIAAAIGVKESMVLPSNGSSEAIWLVARRFLAGRDTVLAGRPTFGEYAAATHACGARLRWLGLPLREEEGRIAIPEKIRAAITRYRPRLVWLCNPNNPTGHFLERAAVERILEASLTAGSLLVIDEAYLNFVDEPASVVDLVDSGHLVLLRSMTKDFGLAGLRLGYVLAIPEHISALEAIQAPWSVNAAAQAAGVAALQDLRYYRRTWAVLRRLTAALAAGLTASGLPVLPTRTNYLIADTGSALRRRALERRLWASRIRVRDCSSFGLPSWIRVGCRLGADNRRLLEVLRAASCGSG